LSANLNLDRPLLRRAAGLLETAVVNAYRNDRQWFDVNAVLRNRVEGKKGREQGAAGRHA
jgi:hypothetical protein